MMGTLFSKIALLNFFCFVFVIWYSKHNFKLKQAGFKIDNERRQSSDTNSKSLLNYVSQLEQERQTSEE